MFGEMVLLCSRNKVLLFDVWSRDGGAVVLTI